MQSLSNGNSPRSSARQSPFRSPRVWIGIPVSLFFLFLALRGQHPDEIRDAFSRVDWRLLPLALLLLYTGIAIRAYRWHILLRPVRDIPTRDVFPVMIIGYAANNVLPLRAGELVRAWVLEQRYGVRKTAALATIAVERLFDGVTMLLFVGGAATVIGLNAELRHVALVAAAIFAAAIAGLVFLLVGGTLRERLLRLVLATVARSPGGACRAHGGVIPGGAGRPHAAGRSRAGGDHLGRRLGIRDVDVLDGGASLRRPAGRER